MYYPSLSKLRKTFIKVMKTSRFAFVRNKKMYPKNVYEVVPQLGGGVWSLSACPGVRNKPLRKKKIVNQRRGCARGGGGMVTSQFELCIITPCNFLSLFIGQEPTT